MRRWELNCKSDLQGSEKPSHHLRSQYSPKWPSAADGNCVSHEGRATDMTNCVNLQWRSEETAGGINVKLVKSVRPTPLGFITERVSFPKHGRFKLGCV